MTENIKYSLVNDGAVTGVPIDDQGVDAPLCGQLGYLRNIGGGPPG